MKRKTWKLTHAVGDMIGSANDPTTPYGSLFEKGRLCYVWRIDEKYDTGLGVYKCPVKFNFKPGQYLKLVYLGKEERETKIMKIKEVIKERSKIMFQIRTINAGKRE